MCFHVSSGLKIKPCFAIRLFDQPFLEVGARLCDSRRIAIRIRPCRANDCPNDVAIADSIRKALQYQSAESFTSGISISPTVKAEASTIRR